MCSPGYLIPNSMTGAGDSRICRNKIEFDGIYMNSSVYFNGHLVGTRPYGYISFCYDITDFLVRGIRTVENRCRNAGRRYELLSIFAKSWKSKTISAG